MVSLWPDLGDPQGSGRRKVASAAAVLVISAMQVNRLLIRFREDGGDGVIHKGRGQSPNQA